VSAVVAERVAMLPMSCADVDEILAIEERAYAFPWTRGNFLDSLASGYSIWGGRLPSQLVGYFVLMPVVDEAHLLNISVAPGCQGVGYGSLLLGHALRIAGDAGAASLLLEVRPSNTAALALYDRFGFSRIGLRRAYYPAANGREDALVLRLQLAMGARCAP